MQRRPWLTKGANLSPSTLLYSPMQRHHPSTLHCFIAVAPLLQCSTPSLPSLHAPLLHCCQCLPRSYVQHHKDVEWIAPKQTTTDLLAKVEECTTQEATIKALPKRIWKPAKSESIFWGSTTRERNSSRLLFRNCLP